MTKTDKEKEKAKDDSSNEDDIRSYVKESRDREDSDDNPYKNLIGRDDDSDRDRTRDDTTYSETTEKESKEDIMLKKLDMLRKLSELRMLGIKLSQNYNIDSDYDMMKFEYELHHGIRAKKNAVQWMSNMMLNGVYFLEMANETYDPFSLKLNGWSDIMNAQEGDYYEVMGELYEKYKQPGKSVSPELRLIFMMGGTALKLHMANNRAESSPTVDEHLRNNPELAAKLRQQAAADRIKKQTQDRMSKINNVANQEHELATRRAAEINMLQRKQMEHQMAQQNSQQINALRSQLQNFDMSSNGSSMSGSNNGPVIQPRKIPQGMVVNQENVGANRGQNLREMEEQRNIQIERQNLLFQQQLQQQQLQQRLQQQNQEQLKQEYLRQQQIQQHKEQLQQQEIKKNPNA